MNGTSRNSVANPPSQASTSRKTPQDKTIPDPMMNLKTDYFSQTPNNQLPYFFADFIKSPHSFGLSKEITKPNEYFVNTSYEQGLEVSSSPKLPYFLKQGSIHQKQKPTISKDPQSCDVIPRIDTSYAASSPPRSFAHFNNLREANRSPDFHKTDFFDAPIDSRLPRAKSSSQNETPIRSGASSTAYTGAMKALQEQIKDFNEKIKELETENECLKSFQREQIRKIEADYHAKIDEYRCSSRNIQDGLDTLEMGTIKLSESKKELEEKMDEMSKENKRLREEKALLKKKLKSMKEDNRFRQETVEEMSKMVREAKEETRGTEDSYKSEMKKMEEEAAGLRKESEELKEKNKSLAEKLGQLEKELKGNKKTYSQHIQQLSLASEALKLDNQEMKEIYGGQLESFKSELEAIHESYTKRINSYEGMVADLSKENSKFKELIALKNREIESLKARTVEYNPLKEDVLVKSLGPEEYLLKDSLFDKSKWSSKNSKHIETSLINKSIVSKIEAPSTIQHSPSEMQRYARRLLTEGDASNRSSVKVSFNYTNLSLEPMRDKNEEVLENGKNSPANTLVTNRISTCESWNMNKQQLAERKEEENNRGNDLIAKEDELSLSSILTENNSFSRKEKAKKALVVENFKSRLSNLSNKFALSSEETNRRQSNPRYSNFLTETDRNNSSSRDHIQTYKKFSKASTSNFSFGEIPKSFRQFGNEENGTQRSSYASPRGF